MLLELGEDVPSDTPYGVAQHGEGGILLRVQVVLRRRNGLRIGDAG